MYARRSIYYTFPVRLLILHLRNHLALVGLWILLTLLMTGVVGRFFGIHYLLLTPEYHGEVNFWSFFLTGAACGAFFLNWNLTTYLLSAHRFPFLATLEAPFTKFSINNSLLPLVFLGIYIAASTHAQWFDEITATWMILANVGGFLAGLVAIIGVLAIYLHLTNKNVAAFLRPSEFIPAPGGKLLAPGYRMPTLWEIRAGATRWRVDTYFTELLHLRWVRSVSHYDPEILGRVFRQNHFNAVIVQLIAVAVLMVLGLFMDQAWARIPTGATIFLLASMALAVFGAITFWFRHWGTLVFIIVMALVNFVTGLGLFHDRNRAYGLDYRPENRVEYNYAAMEALCTPDIVARDQANTQRILDNWLTKNRAAGIERPKLVLVCVSGGGIRSAIWTMQVLQEADEATNGRLLRQTALISGASGGILSAAYLREIYLRQQQGMSVSVHNPGLIEDIGTDLLNPVSFAIVSNDLFFPVSTFRSGGFTYRKDRGYLLERQLNENCRGVLDKRLADYRQPEQDAIIPMMVVSPFTLNDARRLLISPQGVSYLMRPPDNRRLTIRPEVDGVDFGRMFARQQADSLAFTSALRMNCTYPLILPSAWLPTHPAVEVLDAGFRDNYGINTAVRFVQVFRSWIEQHTGGVLIVQVRCWEKVDPIAKGDYKGIVENLFAPIHAATNLTAMQDFDQDANLSLLNDILGPDRLEVIRFIYRPIKKENEASMSLHLSKREKLDILESFHRPEVKVNLAALKRALK